VNRGYQEGHSFDTLDTTLDASRDEEEEPFNKKYNEKMEYLEMSLTTGQMTPIEEVSDTASNYSASSRGF
jgi:hypothetical protein